MAPIKKKSKYDDFFEIKNEKATCKRCGEIISCKWRSTKGMLHHLLSKHGVTIDDKVQVEEESGASSAKKPKVEKGQNTLNHYFPVTSKEPIEDLVAKEAVRGATFRFIASSYLIYKGLCALGFQDEAPKHHSTVSKLVDKSAENHREKLKIHLKNLIEKGQRFCIVTDEWSCAGKRKKYINVTLHLKGT